MSASAAASKNAVKAVSFKLRPSAARGNADHGWLQTYHTWSFASYFDPSFTSYGPLRVLNEDLVKPGTGFGRHSHREAEIFSYIISGELEHKDSLGSLEIMKRGDVQMTSTGTGVSHSEYNRNRSSDVRFLQIWAFPNKARLQPNYFHRHFSDAEKTNRLVKIVAPVGSEGVVDKREANGPTPIHADMSVYASILEANQTIQHALSNETVKAYVHLILKSGYRAPQEPAPTDGARLVVKSGDQEIKMEEGDGLFINHTAGAPLSFESQGGQSAEFILFELTSDDEGDDEDF